VIYKTAEGSAAHQGRDAVERVWPSRGDLLPTGNQGRFIRRTFDEVGRRIRLCSKSSVDLTVVEVIAQGETADVIVEGWSSRC
jgi:hypothetical protein